MYACAAWLSRRVWSDDDIAWLRCWWVEHLGGDLGMFMGDHKAFERFERVCFVIVRGIFRRNAE